MKLAKNLVFLSAAALALAAGSALAADATVTGITVTPTTLKPGDHITVTVQGKINKPGAYCTVDFLKGDGTPWSLAGNPTSFPYTFGGVGYPLWTYNNPGTYKITVRGGSHPATQCDGVVTATINVQAPLKPVGTVQLPGKPVVMNMGDPCPPGWHKTSGSAGSAFTCAANKPMPKIQCPPKTQYFETECAIGCQAIIY
jgi:hypothetical protein